MSTPAIYIAPQGTTSHVSPRYTRLMCPSCAPRAPRVHAAVFQILHMPYGIRNSEFQNRESGNRINYGAVRRISLGPP